MTSGLLDRQVGFVQALRRAGLPVSLAEGLDAARALESLPLGDRAVVRDGLAAALVKRSSHRPAFDAVFDLYFPALLGSGAGVGGIVRDEETLETGDSEPFRHGLPPERHGLPPGDGPEQLADFRDRLADALAQGDPAELEVLAREGVGRFGAMRGRGEGMSSWSAYTALHRVHAENLVDRVVQALMSDAAPDDEAAEDVGRRRVERRVGEFTGLVEADARRRIAEDRGLEDGAARMVQHAVRPPVEQLAFTSARKTDLEELRRQVQPLARRLATRLTREHAARRRGALDFRRTVRASMSTGGVPVEPRYRPRRPGRTDLVVLCDVSGSVANFAQFTLMLVYALREQFSRVRAFTFVDEVVEVTDRFTPGADPVEVLADLAAASAHASRFGRTDYGRAFERFRERHGDALNPRSALLVLGDARSNHADLSLDTLESMAHDCRHAWWLNPEHRRHWDTGDSAASAYGAIVPMVECRNLTQLGEFVRRLAR